MANPISAPLHWAMKNYGSADVIWNLRSPRIVMHTTYIGDALSSILQATIDLQKGSITAHAALESEPGGTRLVFGRSGANVYVQIVSFAVLRTWSGGELTWAGHVPLGELAAAVEGMAQAVLDEHGADGYAKLWRGIPFPAEKLAALRLSSQSNGDR